MEASFDIFDHTADAGIRITAPSLAELLWPACAGLYAVIGELVPGGQRESLGITLAGDDEAMLLRDYLAELLILFDRDHRMVTDLAVTTFDRTRLVAEAETHSVNMESSILDREVKAVTYHELVVRPIPGGVEAIVIVDI